MKKRNIFLTLTLSALVLTSCGTAVAMISNPDDPFADTGKVSVEGNTLKDIYDTIRNGSTYNSDIKTMLNYELAKSYLGTFSLEKDGTIKLAEFDEKSDQEKINFIKTHKAYWNWKNAGISVSFEDDADINTSNLAQYETRIETVKQLLLKQIVKKLYDTVNVDSYKYNSKYYEALYAKYLIDSLNTVNGKDGNPISIDEIYNIANDLKDKDYNTTGTVSSEGFTQGVIINEEYNPEKSINNIIGGDAPLLHIAYYTDYVNDNILPDIVINLLTEQFILENRYSAIGRSFERKIEYIGISYTSTTKTNAYKLLTSYLDTVVKTNTNTSALAEEDLDYSSLTDAWKGIYPDLSKDTNSDAYKLAVAAYGEPSSDWQNTSVPLAEGKNITYIDGTASDGYKYFKNSEYGDLIKNYSTITNNPLTNNSTNESSFTSINSKTYQPQQGLEIKTDAIRAENFVTYGWGSKSDFSSLPSSITDALFSFGIISELDTALTNKNFYKSRDYQYLQSFSEGGIPFLKQSNYYNDGTGYDSVIWDDTSNSKYYIVAVYDYISPSKLASSTDSTSADLQDIEYYARERGYKIASNGTYTTSALQYYVDLADIVYFDQGVYDYFEEQFPDLFD